MDDPYKRVRIALLKYYNSQCMTHAGYVISTFIGLVVAFSRLDAFIATNTLFLFGAIVLGLSLLLVYTLVGTFYWGQLANATLHVIPNPEKEKKKQTRMIILQDAIIKNFSERHPYLYFIFRKKDIGQLRENLRKRKARARKAFLSLFLSF